MLNLPKKRPWILIALFYLLIIGGWVTFIMLARQHSGNKRSPEETEKILKQQTPAQAQEQPAQHD